MSLDWLLNSLGEMEKESQNGLLWEVASYTLLRMVRMEGRALQIFPTKDPHDPVDKKVIIPGGPSTNIQDKCFLPYQDRESGLVVNVNKISERHLASYRDIPNLVLFYRDLHMYTLQDVADLLRTHNQFNLWKGTRLHWFPLESGVFYPRALEIIRREGKVPLRLRELG